MVLFPTLSTDDLHKFYSETGCMQKAWEMVEARWPAKTPGQKEVMIAQVLEWANK